ncbi:MAG: RNA polymerase sigma factor [Planctomycetes bacterium]|nr:RNA polymerase sigma factor [Planctomycetota bacterium]
MLATPLKKPTPTPLSQEEDAELMLRAQVDPAGPAFQVLYERHRREVLGYLAALVRDRDLAEDTLQDVFFSVYEHRARYDSARPFRPWLYRIARNAGLSAITARRDARLESGHELETDSRDEPPRETARRERIEQTQVALAALPPETRALLLQRHSLGMKLTSLAESWGCTERTIRNRLQAACSELASVLSTGSEA